MANMRGVSVYRLASEMRQTTNGKSSKNAPFVTDGLTPEKFPQKEGYTVAPPEQLGALLIPQQTLASDGVAGFQRALDPKHARRIARAISNGTPMPTIEVALHNNAAWVVDGQHRAVAGIVARAALPVLARTLNAEQMKALFAAQGSQKNVNPSIIVLSASDPFSEYVQDAVTSDDHPWSGLVTHHLASDRRLTPNQARNAIVAYVTNIVGYVPSISAIQAKAEEEGTWNRELADEMARIIGCFGTREEAPLPMKAINLRAITRAAVLIIRRHNAARRGEAIKRWEGWMPRFPFAQYQAVTSSKHMTPLLISHWNKRLAAEHRVPLEGGD